MIPKILFGTLRGESLPKTGSTKPKPVPYLVERMYHYNIKNKDGKIWFNVYFLCALNLLLVSCI